MTDPESRSRRRSPHAEPTPADDPAGDDEALTDYIRRFRLAEPEAPRRRRQQPIFRDSSEGQSGRIAGELDPAGVSAGYPMTYRPARFEEVWLRSSLRSFYDQELIVDVLAQVKGGKEANVYRCRAHPRTGEALLAAKVYRPRRFRNLANDQMYREGRLILTADGRPAKPTDHRIIRAIGKKTEFGAQVAHTSWLMYEHVTLARLHAAGGAVPRPFGANENAILMAYHGDELQAAPTLQEVRLGRREARPLFAEVLRNVELLLSSGLVHGDLSAYNVLYWAGAITLIDFPQVIDVHANRSARFALERDVRRICDYFARQGVSSNAAALAAGLWEEYGEEDYGEPGAADWPAPGDEEEEEDE